MAKEKPRTLLLHDDRNKRGKRYLKISDFRPVTTNGYLIRLSEQVKGGGRRVVCHSQPYCKCCELLTVHCPYIGKATRLIIMPLPFCEVGTLIFLKHSHAVARENHTRADFSIHQKKQNLCYIFLYTTIDNQHTVCATDFMINRWQGPRTFFRAPAQTERLNTIIFENKNL